MAASKAEIKRKLKKDGTYVEPLEDAVGPEKSTYHNPKTGQEFHNLPIDPWSLEIYMKRHRLIPGPASPALRRKWKKAQAKLKDPLDEYQNEGAKMVAQHQKNVRSTVDEKMLELIQQLTDKVVALEAKVAKSSSEPETETLEIPTVDETDQYDQEDD